MLRLLSSFFIRPKTIDPERRSVLGSASEGLLRSYQRSKVANGPLGTDDVVRRRRSQSSELLARSKLLQEEAKGLMLVP